MAELAGLGWTNGCNAPTPSAEAPHAAIGKGVWSICDPWAKYFDEDGSAIAVVLAAGAPVLNGMQGLGPKAYARAYDRVCSAPSPIPDVIFVQFVRNKAD